MGNVLSAAVPSLIQAVDVYIQDRTDFSFVSSLGSTRFMKVARVKHNEKPCEGDCVVKVFVIHDPTLCLTPYRLQVEQTKNALNHASNCAPFQKVQYTEKAVLLIRQFSYSTLYDRLSNRPFLTTLEKQWIAFQLLKALEQCAEVSVCHGDIKTQNVLVTSSNWILLTDFATFKPAYLPEDNPSDFAYFFDTSRRRSCYIAPERFLPPSEIEKKCNLNEAMVTTLEESCTASQFTHQMDIFSLGCVLVELFNEGKCPFDLGQLLVYRHKNDHLNVVLQSLPSNVPDLKDMIMRMLCRDPGQRPSAVELLEKYKGTLFPKVFYSFLYPYMETFVKQSSQPLLRNDQKIEKLNSDMDHILRVLRTEDGQLNEASLVIISLVCSLSRHLKDADVKIMCMKILDTLSSKSQPAVVLDIILPYLVCFLSDPIAIVHSEAIRVICSITERVQHLRSEDENMFIEYLLPKLKELLAPTRSVPLSTLGRITLASCISRFAQTSERYLNLAEMNRKAENEENCAVQMTSLTKRKQKIVDVIQSIVQTLFNDSDNLVKRSLVSQDLHKLAIFFGKQKSGDVLLSHLITFLNDKHNWQLRAAFFDSCSTIAVLTTWHAASILKPLLQQGLRDFEETVIIRALVCIQKLIDAGLILKPAVYELLKDSVPFLLHPNEGLRICACSVVACLCKRLSLADVHCKVMPVISVYLRQSLIKLDNKSVLLKCLKPPFPRPVWDVITRSPLLPELLQFIGDKRFLRPLPSGDILLVSRPGLNELGGSQRQAQNLHQKLINLGLEEHMEDILIEFNETLIKMKRMRDSVSEDISPMESSHYGCVDLSVSPIKRYHANLNMNKWNKLRRKNASRSDKMNYEWEAMFGGPKVAPPQTPATPKMAPPQTAIEQSLAEAVKEHEASDSNLSNQVLDDVSIPDEDDRSYSTPSNNIHVNAVDTTSASGSQEVASVCKDMLDELVLHKRTEWTRMTGRFKDETVPETDKPFWKPKGVLVAHLQEHRACVNRLTVRGDGPLFASCSSDGMVKLWDSNCIESTSDKCLSSLANYNGLGGRIKCTQFVEGEGDRIIMSNDSGIVQILDVATMSSKSCTPLVKFTTDMKIEGPLLDLHTWFDGVGSHVIGVTHHGYIMSWDTRCTNIGPVFRKQCASNFGMVTSMCVDCSKQHYACVGSFNGNIAVWDLRFGLSVNTFSHPSHRCVTRLWSTHTNISSPCVWASVAGNGEVSCWNLENGERTVALWSEQSPPLSYDKRSGMYVNSALFINAIHTPNTHPLSTNNCVLTGDSNGCIRFWNMYSVQESTILSSRSIQNRASPGSMRTRVMYKVQPVDGVDVIVENQVEVREAGHTTPPIAAQVTTYHKDAITDMIRVQTDKQSLLVTASRDGVIKSWK